MLIAVYSLAVCNEDMKQADSNKVAEYTFLVSSVPTATSVIFCNSRIQAVEK
ncbi:hypothetical protein BACIH_3041 [Bacillus amyloliquefaciens]|nr:hypothetical protein U471_30630 [Bacillus amyloliquefaciens CC178]QEY90525.1 hypothetical protein BACIT_2650 [Bacillus amyloliquefaciens]QEY94738.1 hypothetical protein BACIH_3041 [Bacillus amyloliquefaciens]